METVAVKTDNVKADNIEKKHFSDCIGDNILGKKAIFEGNVISDVEINELENIIKELTLNKRINMNGSKIAIEIIQNALINKLENTNAEMVIVKENGDIRISVKNKARKSFPDFFENRSKQLDGLSLNKLKALYKEKLSDGIMGETSKYGGGLGIYDIIYNLIKRNFSRNEISDDKIIDIYKNTTSNRSNYLIMYDNLKIANVLFQNTEKEDEVIYTFTGYYNY